MIVVDVGDMKTSNHPDEMIRTYALGSCIGMTAYDPKLKLGALLHYKLPREMGQKTKQNPYSFGNTGIPLLLNTMLEMGAQKKTLQLFICGAAKEIEGKCIFDVGLKNYQLCSRLLKKNGYHLNGMDIGGQEARTMSLYLDTGKVTIMRKKKEEEMLSGSFYSSYDEDEL
ncbi:MAG: chemotaxis protein CheD [Planctomycetes bacterium]|nr:chemotaxis protein CheD [Planctomycetota bacterium]